MTLKKLFLSLWILLWIFEPFLALAVPAQRSKPSVCSTCGMKDKCGIVCCCAHANTPDPECRQHTPGLYAAGCAEGDSAAHFLGESSTKWLPPEVPEFLPESNPGNFAFNPIILKHPALDPLSPPPRTGIFL